VASVSVEEKSHPILRPTVFRMSYVDEGTVKWLVDSVHYLTEQVDQLKGNGHIGEAAVRDLVPLGSQIEHYQPALASSFNHGLGTSYSKVILGYVIDRVGGHLTPYERKAAQGQLQKFASNKDTDPLLGRLRESLKKRVEELFGFSGDSDKDLQFESLDQLAKFLIVVRKEFKSRKLRANQVVDALLLLVFGERVREVLEKPEKHLLCLSCGYRIREKDAILRVTIHRIDEAYVATMRDLLSRAG